MIGQIQLIKTVSSQIETDTFPQFSIFTGEHGSGKKELIKVLIKHFGDCVVYNSNIGVADVREAITYMYNVNRRSIFTFYDVDTMSIQAKNALLKVAEEPPKNVYIIMTVSDINTVLDTIKSRASIYSLDPYSREELLQYAHDVINAKHDDDLICQLCNTPGEIKLFYDQGAEDLWDYAEMAVDNIAEVSGANAFKMANKIAFKDGDEGFSVQLFLKAFRQVCMDRLVDRINTPVEVNKYTKGIEVVSYTIQQLGITGINKVALFDIFILDIRKEWMDLGSTGTETSD